RGRSGGRDEQGCLVQGQSGDLPMISFRRYSLVLVGCAAAVAVSACTSHHDSTPTASQSSPASVAPCKASPFPTLTASNLQPPPNFNKFNSPGHPDVVFDPCTWVPDSAVVQAGFDPASRSRGDDQIAEQTFLMCDFKN